MRLITSLPKATGYQGATYWNTSKPEGMPKKQLDVIHLAKLDRRASIPLVECLKNTFALFRQELVRS